MIRLSPPVSPATDAVLEYAAQLCEQMFVEEVSGIGARRKRVREDAALRAEAVKQTRLKCAEHIRAFKGRRDLDAVAVLERFSSLRPDRDHVSELRDAWPLAWKGLVDIQALISCASNSIPPRTEYRITLTEKGHRLLKQREAA